MALLGFHEILDCVNRAAQVESWFTTMVSCSNKIPSFHCGTLIFLLRSWKKASHNLNLCHANFAAVKTAIYFPEHACIWCRTECARLPPAQDSAVAWDSWDSEAGPALTCCVTLTTLLHLFVPLLLSHYFIWTPCLSCQLSVLGMSAKA